MKKNLKIILSAVFLVALVAVSSVLYQKLSSDYVGDGSLLVGSLLTDSSALSAQLGQAEPNKIDPPTSESPNQEPPEAVVPVSPSPSEGDNSSENVSSGESDTMGSGGAENPNEGGSQEDEQENTEPAKPAEPPKNLAPDFTVMDENGNMVKLSNFRGKPVVLNFWASWCYYCEMEMPDFNAAYKKYPDVQFLMVNATDGVSETVEKAKKFKANNGYDFDIFFDINYEADAAYNVNAYPITYFISAEGELIASTRGMIRAAVLEQGISLILPAKKEEL